MQAVAWKGITKSFGQNVAVDDVTLEIEAGSFFGIVGPNGAGKTTLLRMTTGLLRPDAGSVAIVGSDVWSDPVSAKRRFGLVPDTPRLFDRLTGRELIQFTGELRGMDSGVVEERRESLLRLLDLVEAADVIVADYSLGMTKKVGIAVALLHDPKVLILDEPFAGVDPVARQSLEGILRRHTESGGTVVFSDHAMDVVERLCDRIMLMEELTQGRRLQDVFVELVGARITDEGDLRWLGTSSA
jgi:ABC-2 type transport system ATP-binding protein